MPARSTAAPPQQASADAHPLDRLAGRGWAGGLARLAVAAVVLAVVLTVTGSEALDQLLDARHAPAFAAGAVLVGVQRVVRIVKWSRLVKRAGLLPRALGDLLRVQFVGLLANLAIPVSELLKIWAVSRDRSDAPHAVETIAVEVAWLSAIVGLLGLGAGATLALSGATEAGWLWAPGAGLLATSLGTLGGLWFQPKSRKVPTLASTVLLSAVEAVCILGVYAIAMQSLGLGLEPLTLVAVYPLLYLGHLVVLTPSGLGVREALFALVFAQVSDTPAKAATAVGLMVSASQLALTLAAGGVALLVPGASMRERPGAS